MGTIFVETKTFRHNVKVADMSAELVLSASLEDYLEAIFHIVADKQVARAKDIVQKLGVHNSSVTQALRALSERGLINYAPYEVVTLTHEGERAARDVVHRHQTLRDFFVKVLGIDESDADESACKMEHVISSPILDRLVHFIEYVESCPIGHVQWREELGYYCQRSEENCQRCIELVQESTRQQQSDRNEIERTTISLHDLEPGQKGNIVQFRGAGEAHRRLVAMGLTRGTLVEVIKVAPLGDPVEVKVKGYHLSLRKEEARAVMVEVV